MSEWKEISFAFAHLVLSWVAVKAVNWIPWELYPQQSEPLLKLTAFSTNQTQ